MTIATVANVVGNAITGVTTNASPSDLASAYPGLTKTPTKNFTLSYGAETLSFYSGQAFVGDANLLAAIAAAGQSVI